MGGIEVEASHKGKKWKAVSRLLYLFQFKNDFVAFRARKAFLGLGIWGF